MAIRGFQPASALTNGIGLKMLSNDELERIHLTTLDMLWDIGVKVNSQEALEIFHAGGCMVDKKSSMVKLPAHVVEDAIRSCPPTFRACGRDPEKDFICEKDRDPALADGGLTLDPEVVDIVPAILRKRVIDHRCAQ